MISPSFFDVEFDGGSGAGSPKRALDRWPHFVTISNASRVLMMLLEVMGGKEMEKFARGFSKSPK